MFKAGVYIHIPFCRARCSYCDFATGAFEAAQATRYVAAVKKEIENFALPFGGCEASEVDTVYFGGGTPSLLTPAQTKSLIESVQARFRVNEDAEVTLEINPGTVTLDSLREFRRAGITRASFGAQTFDDRELRRLGRTHSAADVRRTLADLRHAGFANVSFDLIAGLPAQTIQAWERNLNEALALRPEHLSLYLLEVHEGTPLAAQIKRGVYPKPDDDTTAEMYRLLVERLRAAGYLHYEISNFCLPGFQARHNTKYWTTAPVYGFGCAAHSHDGARLRWSNERDIARYMELIETTTRARAELIQLDAQDVRSEAIFLSLRLLERGVNLTAYQQRFGADLRAEHPAELMRLNQAGLIELHDDLLKLTSAGALLSNEVFAMLC